jgi:hypothetical protein
MSKCAKYFPRTAFSPLYIGVRTVELSRKAIVAILANSAHIFGFTLSLGTGKQEATGPTAL